jgi:hypothetical protein
MTILGKWNFAFLPIFDPSCGSWHHVSGHNIISKEARWFGGGKQNKISSPRKGEKKHGKKIGAGNLPITPFLAYIPLLLSQSLITPKKYANYLNTWLEHKSVGLHLPEAL